MRRQSPWIHRFSRPLIGAFAALGVADTAYLTSVKLSGNGVACSSEGCNAVLSSPYANVLGMPLSLFGLLAYLGVLVLAIAPLAVSIKSNKKLHNQLQEITWPIMLIGSVAMMVFSGYLMYLLAVVIKAACPYCIVSAILSTILFGLVLFGKDRNGIGEIIMPVVITAFLTLLVTLGIYSSVPVAVDLNSSSDNGSEEITSLDPIGEPPWAVMSKSGPSELALAEHLNSTGAVMYGASWCPHCYQQKQMFGKAVVANRLKYVECAEGGYNAQVEKCKTAGIKSFPTWDIKGQKYTGVLTMEKLAELTDYQGPKNFKYSKLWGSSR
jgi:uncharacterized membrane protein/glutaredoxin